MISLKKILIASIISIITVVALGIVINRFIISANDTSTEIRNKKTNSKPVNDSISFKELDRLFTAMEGDKIDSSTNIINIAITGLDTRMGSGCNHADANHLLRISLDSGTISLISVPRGTFVKTGYRDTSGLNYLANTRAGKGRERYLKELAKICSIPKVDYYVEFGFSQALGLLEILGFKGNSVQTLRLLRSRQAFGLGDYQRSYNQGEFIRQMILGKYKTITEMPGDLAIRAGLLLVDTDLTYGIIKNIINKLNKSGFPKSESDVTHYLKPKMKYEFRNFDFLSKTSRDSLYRLVLRTAKNLEIDDGGKNNNGRINRRVMRKLNSIIGRAERDSLKFPQYVISRLEKVYTQRTWYQIEDTNLRYSVMKKVCNLLISAYNKTNQADKAQSVKNLLVIEEYLKNSN
jgi:anionic cell wall polymer biosynthesis LytR-Cps2A-Psr (LCP) family protein